MIVCTICVHSFTFSLHLAGIVILIHVYDSEGVQYQVVVSFDGKILIVSLPSLHNEYMIMRYHVALFVSQRTVFILLNFSLHFTVTAI